MIYLALFTISFLLTYFVKNYAIKKSLIAEVNERSSHTLPTPHGGGVAIAVAWVIGLVYLYFTNQIDIKLFYALLIGFVISLVSFFDDVYTLSPKPRLMVQVAVSVVGLAFIGGLESITFGIFNIENQIVTNIFALLLIVWYINLTNFIDGINGYAGSEAIFLSIAGLLLFGGAYFGIFAVVVLGFLYWNYNRAKIFMGDVGSTLIGYNIAIFTIYYANIEAKNLWIWVVLFGLFWFDATLTLFRRYLNSEKLSMAHKKHTYQRLTQAGWSHLKVVNSAVIVNFVLFCIVYFMQNTAVAFFISCLMLYVIVKFVDSKKSFK